MEHERLAHNKACEFQVHILREIGRNTEGECLQERGQAVKDRTLVQRDPKQMAHPSSGLVAACASGRAEVHSRASSRYLASIALLLVPVVETLFSIQWNWMLPSSLERTNPIL